VWHQTVWCASGATTSKRNGRFQRSADRCTVHVQFAESEQRQKTHWIVNSTCPVHHWTVRWPRLSELQRSNPNGCVTWLAHRTIRCTHQQQPNPNGWFGGWGYKYRQPPPPLQGIQVFSHCIQYKSSRLHSKTQNKRSNRLQVPNSFQRLSDL
jgi:glutathionyl-hydroquinone reductase